MWYVRDELDAAEYTETRTDTLEQLREFGDSLSRMKEGNLSLVDDINRIQLVSVAIFFSLFFSSFNQSLFRQGGHKPGESWMHEFLLAIFVELLQCSLHFPKVDVW